MEMPTRLLKPLDLPGGRRLNNRIVMPPMVIWKADESAEVNDAHRRHYQMSAPGCGLVVVEATTVSPEGRLAATQLGLFSDRHLPGLSSLADIIKAAGALPGIQLHHAGGKTDVRKTFGRTPLVPSLLPEREGETQELGGDDIERIVGNFVEGALRAVDAGFEVLEIHGAHGYLGAQFLSPQTNRRDDEWGGAPGPGEGLSGRLGFLKRVVQAVRQAVEGRALVSCRLGVAESPLDSGGSGPALTLEEGLQAAEELAVAGLDLVHVSFANSRPAAIDPALPFDAVLQLSRPVREKVDIPVIAVTGIRTPEEAEAALAANFGSLIAVGRGILADPGWAAKASTGCGSEIERCVRCKPICFHHTDAGKCPARRRLGILAP